MPKKLWKPGQSGNPKGRPKRGLALAELCRLHNDEMVSLLVELARAGDSRCIIACLEFGNGKPAQTINGELRHSAIEFVAFGPPIVAATGGAIAASPANGNGNGTKHAN